MRATAKTDIIVRAANIETPRRARAGKDQSISAGEDLPVIQVLGHPETRQDRWTLVLARRGYRLFVRARDFHLEE